MSALDIRWLSLFADVPAGSIDAACTFWSAATGWAPGDASGDQGEFVPLRPEDGDRYLWLQRVDRPAGPAGWHLDLHVPDRAPAIETARSAGAEVVREGPGYVALRSPGGLPFCLADEDERPRKGPAPAAWPGGRSRVDQQCIDIPADVFADEFAFWSRLTGWPRTGRDSPEFVRLDVPGRLPVRLLLQRLEEDDSDGIRSHADLASDHRVAEVARHEELGATVRYRSADWTTMRDPAGLTYCITDRVPRSGSDER